MNTTTPLDFNNIPLIATQKPSENSNLDILAYVTISFALVFLLFFLWINLKHVRNNNRFQGSTPVMVPQIIQISSISSRPNSLRSIDLDRTISSIPRSQHSFVAEDMYSKVQETTRENMKNDTIERNSKKNKHRPNHDIYADIDTVIVEPSSSNTGKTDQAAVPIYAKVNKHPKKV
ncbi:uncharacterized protein [Antedon mediterranea]|uniref:uncharacterized protein n=1 Tax=Antedon mediterranea TaxID=105859 RepID=UPI003AF99E4A